MRVVLLDQPHLPASFPPFDILFTHDRALHSFMNLHPYQHMQAVTLCKAVGQRVFVRPHSSCDIRSDSYVKCVAWFVGHNVHAWFSHVFNATVTTRHVPHPVDSRLRGNDGHPSTTLDCGSSPQ